MATLMLAYGKDQERLKFVFVQRVRHYCTSDMDFSVLQSSN